jgi:phosphatidylserine/phosphatidylglycerophosphate/cardiolipin synthase-like enzyme
MMRVDGHGAHALLEEFYARWAESKVPPPAKALPRPTDVEAKGNMFVQISRQWPLDAAPGQILRAYIKAIGRATRYIYIENQYWTSSALTDAIVQRLNDEEAPGLQIVIVLPSKAEDVGAAQAIVPEQWFQLNRIRVNSGPGKLLIYQLFRKIPSSAAYVGVYIHAKLAIIDDRWMTVGSANTNNRSMILDAECNAQIAHSEFVSTIRKKIWSELLDDKVGSADEPNLAIEQGLRRIGVKNRQAKLAGDQLQGLIAPFDMETPPRWPRPPEKLRKYI